MGVNLDHAEPMMLPEEVVGDLTMEMGTIVIMNVVAECIVEEEVGFRRGKVGRISANVGGEMVWRWGSSIWWGRDKGVVVVGIYGFIIVSGRGNMGWSG